MYELCGKYVYKYIVRKEVCFDVSVVDVKLVNWHEIWFEFTSLK